MAMRGNPEKSALLVIDVQNGVMASGWDKQKVIRNCARMVDHARSTGVPIIWIQHEAEDLPRNSEEWQLVPELMPTDGEAHVYKQYSDSFADTALARVLDESNIGHLMICGAQTNACVCATTYRAAGEGYDVTLVEDAHTTETIPLDGINLDAEVIVTDLNLSIKWCDWPNQNVTTATTAVILEG